MSEHMGFRVTATLGGERVTDNFQVKSAAIECAQVLERMKLHGICAYVVMRNPFDGEKLIPMEWRVHPGEAEFSSWDCAALLAPTTSRARTPARALPGESS